MIKSPTIIAYLKPTCGWSRGVRAVLEKYELPFDERNIIADPEQREEMVRKSGQPLSPCVDINGTVLADVSGEEVERWLLEQGIVQPNDREPSAPIDRCCSGRA